MSKEKDGFNPAFKNLHTRLAKARKRKEKPAVEEPLKKNLTPNDSHFFSEAMSGVTPLPDDKKRILRSRGLHISPSHPAPDDERETMTLLYGLVRGSVEMDMTFTDEYVEGSVKGFSRKLMKKLKRGEFPVQDYIDLHGLTRQEAKKEVQDFLIRSHKFGLRCVLIVHGRGLNSPDSFPVLKEGLPLWLGRGSIRKIVLAFATARPYDGGTGAIYVLIRKR